MSNSPDQNKGAFPDDEPNSPVPGETGATPESLPEHGDDDVDLLIAEIRGRLQDGGPEVDPGALFAYIDDDLPEGDKREVQKRIAYWRAWHDAYWRLRADLDAAE